MPLSLREWDERYRQQAGWTAAMRAYLLALIDLSARSRILEVGCGTGAVTSWLRERTLAKVFGVDLEVAAVRFANTVDRGASFAAGDGLHLPFAAGQFDAVTCHFLLLWIQQPGRALDEMVRVTRSGGAVIAFAEPDYGGRIDHPAALAELGRQQTAALHSQGADPRMGRQLSGLFHAAGLRSVETGVLGGQWQGAPAPEQLAAEWDVIRSDLGSSLPAAELEDLRRQDEAAWQSGARVLFVPTFYAIGWK